ncbi:hypothetical protein BDZ89DRAFT_1049750 [Hymenopellis radicata]|nr:hypothetical protein BDZ89DRAFT_1049750 [Hymenopellis radicata]
MSEHGYSQPKAGHPHSGTHPCNHPTRHRHTLDTQVSTADILILVVRIVTGQNEIAIGNPHDDKREHIADALRDLRASSRSSSPPTSPALIFQRIQFRQRHKGLLLAATQPCIFSYAKTGTPGKSELSVLILMTYLHLVRVAFEEFQRHQNNSILRFNERVCHRMYDERSLMYMRDRQPTVDISPLRASQASPPMTGWYQYQIRRVDSSRGLFLIHLEENQKLTHGKQGGKKRKDNPSDAEGEDPP